MLGAAMSTPMKRVSLDLDPDIEGRLEMAAAGRGIGVSEYCMQAIRTALDSDGAHKPHPVTQEWIEEANALRNKIFRGRIASDSVELIREARRERDERIERVIRGD